MLARLLFAAASVAFAIAVTGCARVEQALAPEPTVVTIEATQAVPGADVNGELAEGLPADLPLWPGADVRSSTAASDAYTLALVTTEKFDDVVPGLAAGFERAGWEVMEELAGDEGSEAGTASASPRATVLTVSGAAGGGIVTVTEGEGAVLIEYVIGSAS